jgi:hypothetical protein
MFRTRRQAREELLFAVCCAAVERSHALQLVFTKTSRGGILCAQQGRQIRMALFGAGNEIILQSIQDIAGFAHMRCEAFCL